jgi:hypothetical protein
VTAWKTQVLENLAAIFGDKLRAEEPPPAFQILFFTLSNAQNLPKTIGPDADRHQHEPPRLAVLDKFRDAAYIGQSGRLRTPAGMWGHRASECLGDFVGIRIFLR